MRPRHPATEIEINRFYNPRPTRVVIQGVSPCLHLSPILRPIHHKLLISPPSAKVATFHMGKPTFARILRFLGVHVVEANAIFAYLPPQTKETEVITGLQPNAWFIKIFQFRQRLK